MARTGMATIISRWRRLVFDAGTVTWTDDQAQTFLDDHRADQWAAPLAPIGRQVGPGTVLYTVYSVPNRGPIEGTASGTAAWRLFDSTGSAIPSGTATYTFDDQRGVLTFTSDQQGSARYADFREFDLYGAAADALDERAASVSSVVDFQSDDQRFSFSQQAKSWQTQATAYRALAWPTPGLAYRSDTLGGDWEAMLPVGPSGYGPSY